MRYAKNDLADLTEALNAAILELGAPLAPADGTLASATTQLNALLVWAGSTLSPANGTLPDDFRTYNYFVRGEQITLWQESNRVAGRRYESEEVAVPEGIDSIKLILTSANWLTAGEGTLEWGVENSQDNGQTWAMTGGTITPFGYLNKGWLMPTLSLSGLQRVGGLWRLYLLPSNNIRVGIQGRLI